MRKLSIFVLGASLSFGFVFGGFQVREANADERIVYVGGMSAGFTLKSGEAQIVGLCEVITENGVISPAVNAGLRTGDRIVKVAGIRVETIEELNEIVNKSQGKALAFEVNRGKETLSFSIQPVKDKISNKYKIGILARDSVSGIGTVTYIDRKNGRFGSLGHSVMGENNAPLRISDGTVYDGGKTLELAVDISSIPYFNKI